MKIALHHTAVKSKKPQIYGVNRYHKGKWNMKSKLGWYVGYNFFCEEDGTRTNTREIGEETIANRGHNCDIPERCDTISYCMAGDFNVHRPPDAQNADFRAFIAEMRELYQVVEVMGHRDLQENRTCPGLLITAKDFDRWNIIEEEDDADKKKIAELQSTIDKLRFQLSKSWEVIYSLVRRLTGRKK